MIIIPDGQDHCPSVDLDLPVDIAVPRRNHLDQLLHLQRQPDGLRRANRGRDTARPRTPPEAGRPTVRDDDGAGIEALASSMVKPLNRGRGVRSGRRGH
ncbi:hypothetical protein ACFVTC_34055 [Streptomyces sp. NPDC057950]|uniref:hypothetical protein n=1 Tax=Streptomyces sp. NPDC057950 TaxID=3346288 RepID=UPI0036EE712A